MREEKNTFIHCIKADNPFDLTVKQDPSVKIIMSYASLHIPTSLRISNTWKRRPCRRQDWKSWKWSNGTHVLNALCSKNPQTDGGKN